MVLTANRICGAFSSVVSTVARKVAPKGATTAAKSVTGDIINNLPRLPRLLAKLKQHDGETLNILTTAVGTAFVAPLFIAFNPLSKEDKDTKIYSAMRQPISAVLAVGTQIGTAVGFNKWVANLAKNGKLDIMKGLSKAEAANTLKLVQKYGGILVTLATLPITCGILNWAYPRIMEKIMPDVANAKKASTAPAAATVTKTGEVAK